MVSLDRGRRQRKGGTRWEGWREVKESTLSDLLERATSGQTTTPPPLLTRHNLTPSAPYRTDSLMNTIIGHVFRPRMEGGEETRGTLDSLIS